MSEPTSRKRPWLAAVLAAIVTGLGHLYLRRWRRAIGWLAVLYVVSVLFVDTATLEALLYRQTVDLPELAPLLVAGGLSVADAYFLAHVQNAVARRTAPADGERAAASPDAAPECPNCGRELDPDIEFCHWCTAELEWTGDGAPRER